MDTKTLISAYETTLFAFARALYKHFGYEDIVQAEILNKARYGGLSYDTTLNKIVVSLKPASDFASAEKKNPDPRVQASCKIIEEMVQEVIRKNSRASQRFSDSFLFTAFCVLHELGHYLDFQNQHDYYDSESAHEACITQLDEEYQRQISLGMTPEAAARQRELTYRKLPEECTADNYAKSYLGRLLVDLASSSEVPIEQ